MSPAPDKRGNLLGYFAAFTLGVICCGVMIFVGRPEKIISEAQPASEIPAEPPVIESANTIPRKLFSGAATPRLRTDLPQMSSEAAPEANVDMAPESPSIVVPPPVIVPRPVTTLIPVGSPRKLANMSAVRRIIGHIELNGTPPKERVLPIDPQCAALQPKSPTTQFYVMGKDHSLADVCVVVSQGLPSQSWLAPTQSLVLQEWGCLFDHYVSVAQVNQPIIVQNRDRTLHIVRVSSIAGGETRVSLMPERETEIELPLPEMFVRFKCDIHSWEIAYVSVIDHPFFALTDTNGNFTISGLPPGRYTIEARHRKAGVLSQQVDLTSEEDKTIKFMFDAKNEPSEMGGITRQPPESKRNDSPLRPWRHGQNGQLAEARAVRTPNRGYSRGVP